MWQFDGLRHIEVAHYGYTFALRHTQTLLMYLSLLCTRFKIKATLAMNNALSFRWLSLKDLCFKFISFIAKSFIAFILEVAGFSAHYLV